ncbi:MAG: zinc-dependent metalloprotease, partial [Flavobacteriales bacterium]|nr:zinc-dependent metalloprotease [Flavobacteriales bacterium]
GVDTHVQFCLAAVAPNGQPTTGINRVNGTSVSGYAANGITGGNELAVKTLSRWDNRYYLNVWVVSEIDGNGADTPNPANFSGGVLGYAYLPTNPVTFNSDRDGVVIVNLGVGNDPNQNQGFRLWPWGALTNRLMTHEVGHYLNLDHTFEGGSCSETNCNTQGDRVCDTPPTVQGSTCNSPACNNSQVENYMDYTSENCLNMFTNGQGTRMQATLSSMRNALVNTSNCGASNDYDASVSAIVAPSGSLCQTDFTPNITLTNFGSTTLTSVQISYYIDANAPTTYNWTGSLAQNASVSFNLPGMTTTNGAHTFTATTVSGTLNTNNTDQETSNDQSTSGFNVGTSGTAVTLTLDLDCYGSETSWEIRNSNNQVMASGGPYVDNVNGQQIVEGFCLADGCYDFIIADSYLPDGDGMYGSQWNGCSINGNYQIVDGSNATLVQMTAPNADFGLLATHNFCIGGGNQGSECFVLTSNYEAQFLVNNDDFPNFGVENIDVDQEAVATVLADANYTSEWMGVGEIVSPGDTNFFLRVTSWFQDETAAADNWFNFGQTTILSDGGEVRWKHRMPDNGFRDGYEVLVNFNGTSISDFNGATVLYSVAENAPATDGDTLWTQQAVDLPMGTYAGQTVYIAFHHIALNQFLLDIDDIEVIGCTSPLVGISENEEFDLKVYPNPSSQNFTVQYSANSDEDLNFRMLNSIGQEVWRHQSSGGRNSIQTIDTGGLSSGVYTLVVRGENMNISERLVLTK